MTLEDIAGMITGDGMLFMVGEDLLPKYKCDCQKSRIENGLISLGKKELDDIINTDGKAEVECKFCKKKYTFSMMIMRKQMTNEQKYAIIWLEIETFYNLYRQKSYTNKNLTR